MVAMATRPSGRRATGSPQTEITTVMLGHTAFNGYVMNYPPPERSEFLQPEMRKIVDAYFTRI